MDEAFQNELHAMQEVGRDRSRTRAIAFGLAWLVIAVLLFAVFRFGLILAGLISAPLAGGVAIGVTKSLTPGFIKRAAHKYGIDEDKLRPDKYLVD